MTKAQSHRDSRREARIDQEAVVDAYTSDERAMGWYYYLEGKVKFPFTAICTTRRATSPFAVGESLSVIGLAPEEDCMAEIIVITEFSGRTLGVPLAQIRPRNADVSTAAKQAIEDWHYWVAMGYQY